MICNTKSKVRKQKGTCFLGSFLLFQLKVKTFFKILNFGKYNNIIMNIFRKKGFKNRCKKKREVNLKDL